MLICQDKGEVVETQRKSILVEKRGAVGKITINRVVPADQLQESAWQWGEEIRKFDKITLQYCKTAAHASMEASSVPAVAEIGWLMQEEHALVNSRAYTGTREFHK